MYEKSKSMVHLALLGFILALVLAPTGALARRVSASGPILRPIAWQGEFCPLEAFCTMIFTAQDTVANVKISAETFTTHPDCSSPEITHRIFDFYAMERSFYEAHRVPTMALGPEDRCLEEGINYDVFNPSGTSPGDYVLYEDFSSQMNGNWVFNGGEFNPGSDISLIYDPGVGDVSTAEVMLTGLTPGEEYAVTFVHRNLMPCDFNNYFSTMTLEVDNEPGILRVAADGTGDFLTIGSALAVAQPGETLLVSPGNYYETELVLPPGVSIVGDTDIVTLVVLDAQGVGTILTCQDLPDGSMLKNLMFTNAGDSAVNLSNSSLEIENCFFELNHSDASGGAINAAGAVAGTEILRLTDCEFSVNSASINGGGLNAFYVDVEAVRTIFRANSSITFGGGVDLNNNNASFLDCEFTYNHCDGYGGGLSGQNYQSFTMTDCLLTNNICNQQGGALRLATWAPAPVISNSTFTGNDGNTGAAFHMFSVNAPFEVSGCGFVDNGHSGGGAPVYLGEGHFDLRNCSLVDNASTAGVISGSAASSLNLDRSLLAFNQAYPVSGLVPVVTAQCSDVYENTGGNYVGGLAGLEGVNDNILLDPLLCDLAGGNIGIGLDSPCMPANNPGGCFIGSESPGCAGESPLVNGVYDVPNDQGRQARVAWLGSTHDGGAAPDITGYAVYRRADFKKNNEKEMAQGPDRYLKLAGWDYLVTVPARGDTAYQTIVPTLCDSTAGAGICWSTFMVSALTSDPLVFFDSPPDSGYSVDNLSPVAPSGLTADFTAAGVHLAWDVNPDPDVHLYNVYRAVPGDCDHPTGLPVAQATFPAWTDDTAGDSFFNRCYVITAVDFAGNEGPPSTWSGADVSAVPMAPKGFDLRPGAPNPFNPQTTFAFTLDQPGKVALEIFDTRGRKVRTLVQGNVPAGSYEIDWRGRDDGGRRVASGVYLVRLRQADRVAIQRVTMLK